MAYLPFLQVPQDTFPRARMLARILRVPEYQGIGLMVALDAWALERAPEGDMSGVVDDANPAEFMALGLGWTGDPVELLAALIRVRLVEEGAEGVRVLTLEKYAKAMGSKPARSEAGRRAAQVRWHGKSDADRMSDASISHATSMRSDAMAMPANAKMKMEIEIKKDPPATQEARGSAPPARVGAGNRPTQVPLVEVSATPPPVARARPPAAEPRTTNDERDLQRRVLDAYQLARGEAYAWRGEDWNALRACLALAQGDADTLLERWVFALELGAAWPGCSRLRELHSKWEQVLVKLQERGQGERRRPSDARHERAARGGDVPNVPGFQALYRQGED